VHDEIEMLQHYGHSVELLEQDNDAIHGFCGKLIAATSVFYSARSRKRMKDVIHDFCPDVVHIHNWFPMLSPSIIMEADASRIPIVQTLHNYRMLCANAQLYRDGVICTDCLGKSLPLDGVIHGCYRGSRTGSAIVTAAYAFHRLVHTWDRVDLFIAVSGFEREILRSGGLPAERMAVKPNFVGSNNWEAERKIEEAALFVGRLSPGKGIRTLLSAWNTGRIPLRLKIIGDGPMADEIRSFAAGNTDVEYQGQQSLDAVYREMAKAKFLVFPSELFETFGRTVVEAYSQGTPVLVSDLGGMQELVEEGVTGFCFPPGNIDALIAGTLRFPTGEDYERMRTNCRNLFLRKFTPEINYAQLMEIYARAIAIRKTRQQTR
jgi:glycosyltransferase involved in cell wall biosynthesis